MSSALRRRSDDESDTDYKYESEIIVPQVAPYVPGDTGADHVINWKNWHRACEFHEEKICESKEPRIPFIPFKFIQAPKEMEDLTPKFSQKQTKRELPQEPAQTEREKRIEELGLAPNHPRKLQVPEMQSKQLNGVVVPEWKIQIAMAHKQNSDDEYDWKQYSESSSEEEELPSDDDFAQLSRWTPRDEEKLIRRRLKTEPHPKLAPADSLNYEMHPAYCSAYAAIRTLPLIAKSTPLRYACLKYDKNLTQRVHKIPRFWEPKSWDDPDRVMTEREDDKLRLAIQQITDKKSMLERMCE